MMSQLLLVEAGADLHCGLAVAVTLLHSTEQHL